MKNKIIILLEIISICLIVYLIFTKEAHSQEIYKSPNIKVYAFEKVLDKWGDKQWVHFSELVYKESGWKDTADNPKSSAYGLGQFLDSTWKTVGCKKTPDKYVQIDCMLNYIELRYDTPYKAMVHHKKNNWY